MPTTPTETITVQSPAPIGAAIAIASSMPGKESTMSSAREMAASTPPPA
jgi:hypothetical protein